ncbi:MAG: CoA transferase, partial [Acidimicrobiaceae bacterium]|nr:CoA transferase [Acidimicrobiaceae bacterium]
DRVGMAIRVLPLTVVEDRVIAAGGVAAGVRSASEWAQHGQGQAVSSEPLITHRSIPGAPPRGRAPGGLPVKGVRVLDLTRLIAGPVCTRYLGALGADVLRLDPPDRPDMPPGSLADTLLAKRSAAMDLAEPGGVESLHELLDHADVVVCGYRPGSLERFGLATDELASRHPGLVIVRLNAWGHSGPWAERRGFDSVVQAPTGIARGEAAGRDEPGALPCQLLDHGTGYLAAAAALDGLRRQSVEGGTHIRALSLARTASWLVTSGAGDMHHPPDPGRSDEWIVDLEARPRARAVAPPGVLDGRPLQWPGPPPRYLMDPAEWLPPG